MNIKKKIIAWMLGSIAIFGTLFFSADQLLKHTPPPVVPQEQSLGAATVLTAPQGGTGLASYTRGDILIATSTTAFSKIGIGSATQTLTVVNGIPTWYSPTKPFCATVGSSNADYITDGSNDVSKINQAILSCLSSGGGVVVVQSGDFNISSNLNLKNGVDLMGSGSSTMFYLAHSAKINLNSVAGINLSNFSFDGSDHVLFDRGIEIINSSDIHVDNVIGTNLKGFGIFIESSGISTSTRVWVSNSNLYGLGNNDIIGGGPQNSTGASVSDVFITNNFIHQDSTVGNNYKAALDIVGVNNITISGNHTFGHLHLGNEQFPNTQASISGNIVRPAVGANSAFIDIEAASAATTFNEELNIQNNILNGGYIYAYGTSTAYARNIVISGNQIKTNEAQGIKLDHTFLSTVSNNVIDGATDGISLVNTSFTSLNGNVITGALRGIHCNIASTIAITGNVFSSNTITPVFGCGSDTQITGNINATSTSPDILAPSNSFFQLIGNSKIAAPNNSNSDYHGTADGCTAITWSTSTTAPTYSATSTSFCLP